MSGTGNQKQPGASKLQVYLLPLARLLFDLKKEMGAKKRPQALTVLCGLGWFNYVKSPTHRRTAARPTGTITLGCKFANSYGIAH